MTDQVVVYRSYDPLAVELAEARLRAAEIPFVRAGRGSAALLGMGDLAIEQLVAVALEHAQQARELLAAGAVAADDDQHADEEPASDLDSPTEPRAASRAQLFALALALALSVVAALYFGRRLFD